LLIERLRHGKAAQQPLGYLLRLLLLGKAFQQNGELVTPQPGHGIAGAHTGVQPAGGFHQKQIARGMTQRVVQQLEAVQIDEQHRENKVRIELRFSQGALQLLPEQNPVGQPRQGVAQSLLAQFFLDLFALEKNAPQQHNV
jgi:hypothetical protein